MANEKVVHLDENNFDDVVNSSTPTLVDFWAGWCGPCRMVAPTLDQIADERDSNLTVAKVDIDTHQTLAMRYQVQSIPTFLLFQNGEIKDRMMGAMPKSAFDSFIDRNV
ncbi:MAG: thioredoxin [Acidobacteriota bacterium]